MWRWLVHDWHWPAAALFCACFLLAVLPAFAITSGTELTLVLVQLPVYMLHQWEEHQGDRFRLYFNRTVGGGREALTPAATFWINSIGIWAVDLLALYLAVALKPSAGLIAGYITLFNAVIHVVTAVARREYNPGLITALLLFVPCGIACVYWVGSQATLVDHVLALGGAILLHALIIVYIVARLKRLRAS